MIHHIGNNQIIDEVINNEKLVVIDFFATWCMPCQMMSEVLHHVEEEFGEVAEFFKVDVDESQDIAVCYNVTSMPTLIFFKNGEEVERKVGFIEEDELIKLINEFAQ